MTQYTLIQLPWSNPDVFFVRKTEVIEEKYWIFFKKKKNVYTDSPPGTIEQAEQYIKDNNIEIQDAKFW